MCWTYKHSPSNLEEGFCDELHQSTSCAVQNPLEIGERTLWEASCSCLSSQQQHTTVFHLSLHMRHVSSCTHWHHKMISTLWGFPRPKLCHPFSPSMNVTCNWDIPHSNQRRKLNMWYKFHFLVEFPFKNRWPFWKWPFPALNVVPYTLHRRRTRGVRGQWPPPHFLVSGCGSGPLSCPIRWRSHPTDRARGQVRREPRYLILV